MPYESSDVDLVNARASAGRGRSEFMRLEIAPPALMHQPAAATA